MSPDKTAQLRSNFPLLYQRIKYFECGDGWYDLLWLAGWDMEIEIRKLQAEGIDARYLPHAVRVLSVDDTLEFQLAGGGTNEMWDAIAEAESLSTRTCEQCGRSIQTCTEHGANNGNTEKETYPADSAAPPAKGSL
jgi:hypothetical protein